MTDAVSIDLNIRAENVQEIYSWYLDGRLVVNRRYQRKLVWSAEEKAQLIRTMERRYPLPLILLAEITLNGVSRYEIIDGVQRLNAIVSFVENRLSLGSQFFDLAAMASTSQLADEGKLEQKTPKLDRKICTQFANYKIPISTYRIDSTEDIDEIFRRINSNGRPLSRQEIRQAGVTGPFADVVRKLAAGIRGDVSHSDILPLNDMDKISITSRELEYGVVVEDIYWVKNGILRKEDIRDSKDEDLIADLVTYLVSPPGEKPNSSSAVLDAHYGRPADSSIESQRQAEAQKRQIDILVSKEGISTVEKKFLVTHDLMRHLLSVAGEGFRRLVHKSSSANYGVPRYYQVIFCALYELQFVDKQQVADVNGLIKVLDKLEQHIKITTGGNWSATNRTTNIDAIKGIAKKYFRDNPLDPATITGKTEFENLITRSKTEASSYDFKQGLHRLDNKRALDEESIQKVLETICAIANLGKGRVGYIIIGVADKEPDAARVHQLDGLKPLRFGHFFIVGIDREAKYHTNLDKYLQFLSDKINQSDLSDEIRIKVASNISALDYEGRTIFVIRIDCGSNVCFIGDRIFKRVGSQTIEVKGKEIANIVRLFQ